jgi:hypothetical protein
MCRWAVAVTLVCLAPAFAAAQAPPGCGASEHRQFDFWLGDWTVTDSTGTKVYGTNRVTSEESGCVVHEHWTSAGTGANANTGQSLNAYDLGTKQWSQDWVGSGGDVLHLRGGLVGGAMVLLGEAKDPRGTLLKQRVTWTPYPDGRVRQFWQTSSDGGTTWTVAFDGWYRRTR